MKVLQGDKRKKQERRLFVGVNIIWNSDRNQPYLAFLSQQSEMLFLLLKAQKVSVQLHACVFMCRIYLHAYLCAHDIPERMCACLGLGMCVQTDKALSI